MARPSVAGHKVRCFCNSGPICFCNCAKRSGRIETTNIGNNSSGHPPIEAFCFVFCFHSAKKTAMMTAERGGDLCGGGADEKLREIENDLRYRFADGLPLEEAQQIAGRLRNQHSDQAIARLLVRTIADKDLERMIDLLVAGRFFSRKKSSLFFLCWG
jgi:hypothetical protein